jgi:hypothetical protein
MSNYPDDFRGTSYDAPRTTLPDEVVISLDEVKVGDQYMGCGLEVVVSVFSHDYGKILRFEDRWPTTIEGRRSVVITPVEPPAIMRNFYEAWIETADGQRAIQRAIDDAMGDA